MTASQGVGWGRGAAGGIQLGGRGLNGNVLFYNMLTENEDLDKWWGGGGVIKLSSRPDDVCIT